MNEDLLLNSKIFREYDIRGIVDVELNNRTAYLIGQAFGSNVIEGGGQSIVVGYDGRLTSVALENALVKGLQSTGLDICRVGLGPTPLVYFASYSLKVDAALMVTGSHNADIYNGFKMTLFHKPFHGEHIKALEKRIQTGHFVKGHGSVKDYLLEEDYIDYLWGDFEAHYKNAQPLKVVWDGGNGATGNCLQKLIQKLPGIHILLNEKIDGHFPAHHPDPTVEENLHQLRESVKIHQADLGFAFDGDGDRLGVIDDQGNIIWGDQLLILLSQEVLKTHPGATIIADVKASQILFDKIKEQGGVPLMWRTGHSLIKTKMALTNSPLAGEMSGHIFYADRHFGYDDALYAALRTLGIVSTRQEKLSVWYNHLPKSFHTPELRIPCHSYDKFTLVTRIQQALQTNQVSFNDLDGVRVTYDHGWWLLRASNTTDDLIIRIEAQTQEGLDRLKAELKSYFHICHLTDINLGF